MICYFESIEYIQSILVISYFGVLALLQSINVQRERTANGMLKQQIEAMQEEEKQREFTVRELKEEVKRLKLQCLDESKYMEWNHEEIAAWIMGLDKGRFVKYEKMVKRTLREEEVDGSTLGVVDGADLKRWGITKFADFKHLMQQIEKLVAKNSPDKNGKNASYAAKESPAAPSEGAPTAYHL